MRKQTVLLVMALCVAGIVICILWGERDAESALRVSAESRLAQAREQLVVAEAAKEDAQDALAEEKTDWEASLAELTLERDELAATNTELQAQAMEDAEALTQAETLRASLEASLSQAQADAAEAQAALKEKAAAMENMSQEISAAQAAASQAEDLQAQLERLQTEKETLAAECAASASQLEAAQGEQKRLADLLSQAQEDQARYAALREETEAARLIWDLMEQDMGNLAVRKAVEAAIANFQEQYPDSLMVFRMPDQ